jgi:hypothetical protein
MKFRHCYIAIVLIVSSPAGAAPAPVCLSPAAIQAAAAHCTSASRMSRGLHIELSENACNSSMGCDSCLACLGCVVMLGVPQCNITERPFNECGCRSK